ncbi:mitochondrial chaperone-like protein Frataxin [Pleomassaria siparia CBS 279.74]|uniref:ferroxidase n=1 Tax=Pleomassaria siparia CBS 279.74 TaxID=1314801 RepID=A0A6G1K6M0_9PLEO|nr:mitochondrial chaperone-like protein Frataxin [Pleomassaria siparia CBS 279.74]
MPSRLSAKGFIPAVSIAATTQRPVAAIRDFHSSMATRGLMPDAENPAPKMSEDTEQSRVPTDISESKYNKLADEYLESLVTKLEAEQEKRQDVDVEYSAGVLEVSVVNKGIYVLNKQPPNKQIWLSSPLSGPKRFDWVVTGESMHEKEGTGTGDWVYLRDGTSLSEIIRKELGVDVVVGTEADDI